MISVDTGSKMMHTPYMKLKSLFIPLLLISAQAWASDGCNKQIRVAVIDTGLDLKDPRFTQHLCKTGHQNFVKGESINDILGHGTHVAGLIEMNAADANYCLLIYKYYGEKQSGRLNLSGEVRSIIEAARNGAHIINFSGGGNEYSQDEATAIQNHPEITFVVAAGNENTNLDAVKSDDDRYYPASLFYLNMEVVGGLTANGYKMPSSNYSIRINNKELGANLLSYLPNGNIGYMSGTSQATAVFTGKLIHRIYESCEKTSRGIDAYKH